MKEELIFKCFPFEREVSCGTCPPIGYPDNTYCDTTDGQCDYECQPSQEICNDHTDNDCDYFLTE